jgi:hypothetical protein
MGRGTMFPSFLVTKSHARGRKITYMTAIPIEQAIYSNAAGGGYRFLARSTGFLDEWLPEAERICTGFGERPAGVACPLSVFAQPFGLHHVAVVQAADQGSDDAGRPGALGFRLLVIPRKDYQSFLGDPFAIAERFPPSWGARNDLPTLDWPREFPARRTVDELQKVLKGGNSATLLGGAQALVDGGGLVFERSAPDDTLVRGLWTLLPWNTRARLWPASFVFGNSLGFDVLVLPRADEMTFTSYLNEEQAGDYPEGRYERSLQVAVEAGDQAGLGDLFARRSSSQTLKLAMLLLVAFSVIAVAMQLVTTGPAASTRTPPTRRTEPPLEKSYPHMRDAMVVEVAHALTALIKDLGMERVKGKPKVTELLAALDERLGTPDPQRYPGPLKDLGEKDYERQLRALLWKHHVDGFDDPRLNGVELVERLRAKLLPQRRSGFQPDIGPRQAGSPSYARQKGSS